MSSPVQFSSQTVPSTLTDVVHSYRRAQTFLSGSNITSSSHAFPEDWAERDEETSVGCERQDADEIEAMSEYDGQGSRVNDSIDPLWDDAVQARPIATPGQNISNERTVLISQRKLPFQNLPNGGRMPQRIRQPIQRRISTNSLDVKYHSGGNSTFGQTLFNSIAILLGIGMLSEPLAFAYAGWGAGTLLIIFIGFITCYTAKILAHIIHSDYSLRTYADIGYKAFGRNSRGLTSVLFGLELFGLSVVLVTLYADSLHLVIPAFSSNQYKILGLSVLIPTVFFPLSVLSYASVLGIMSTVLLVVCIFIDGFSKTNAPGSLFDPAYTEWGVKDYNKLGISFGLFMAGFAGHAVIPSLVRDMKNPSQFDKMINYAFAVATLVYGIIGVAGYLMFGASVSQEVSKDILATPGYDVALNNLVVWMLVIAPLSKFALSIRPLNLTIEILLGIDKRAQPLSPSRPPSPTTRNAATLATSARTSTHPWLIIVERSSVVILAVAVSILIPEFSTVMAFLGSFSAFVLCVIGPLCAKMALQRKYAWYDLFLLAVSVVMAAWGTYAAFT